MQKTLSLATILLLSSHTLAAEQDINDYGLTEGHNAGLPDEHIFESYYHFEKITEFTKEEITEFWKNKTNGEYCTSLFGKIVDKYQELTS